MAPVVTIRPAEGALSDLSSLGLREVVRSVMPNLTVDTPDEAAPGELFASSNPLRGSHVQYA
jgi:hypothetical protein